MLNVLLPASFRGRLALLFGLLSFVVGLPTYLYISSVHQKQLIADQSDRLQALANSTATVFSENLTERQREIEFLSRMQLYSAAPLDSSAFQANLELLKASYAHYSWLGLTDADGIVRAASSGHLLGVDVSKRPWFAGGRQGIFAGDLHEALLLAKLLEKQESGQPIRFIDFAAPVHDAGGKLLGVLGAHIHWRWANSVMSVVRPANAKAARLDIFVVNKDSQIIFPEDDDSRLQVPAALSSGDGRSQFVDWGDGDTYLSAVAAIRDPVANTPLDWRVVVRQPRSVILAGVTELQHIVLSVSIAAALVFLLLSWAIAGSISRPLERLTELARRLEDGNEDVAFDAQGGSTELRRLSSALQRMANKLLDSKHTLEAKVAERTEDLQRLNERLENLARTDTLTQVANRLAGNERLELEFSRFRRSGVAYTLLMMDIDFFKRVNDTHGHPVGDAVLQHVATLIGGSIRRTDFLARVGGEEFMVLLPMTSLADGLDVAEQIRAAVGTSPIEPVGAVSISVGVTAVSNEDADADVAVRRADQHLYQAKAEGRNRVVGDTPDAR
ncbi:MAG: diguanylate cyclase [Propionivibrio sp.]